MPSVACLAAAVLACGIAATAQAQSVEWAASLFVYPFPSPFVSEWERNPQSAVLTLVYSGTNSIDYIVEGEVRSSEQGLLARGRSPLRSIPGGPATEIITSSELLDWELQVASQSEVDQIVNTGVIPEGRYELCAHALTPSGIQLTEVCTDFEIALPDPPELIFPIDGDRVTALQPVFQWTPVQVPVEVGLAYRVRMAEIIRGQTPQTALLANRVHFETEILAGPILVYPLDALAFESGKRYAWQVEAVDRDGLPVTASARKSEIWTFTAAGGLFDPIPTDALLPDTLPLIPGAAVLLGFSAIELEETEFGYVLNGPAQLEVTAPVRARARVQLQDLTVDRAALGTAAYQAGRVTGTFPSGLLDPANPPFVELGSLEYSPAAGLTVRGTLTLPGGTPTPMEGTLQVTAAGLFGRVEATAGSETPLATLTSDPVGLELARASATFPDGRLDVLGTVTLFGNRVKCEGVTGTVDPSGALAHEITCGPEGFAPLAVDTDRARVRLQALTGSVRATLGQNALSYDLAARTELELDAASTACAAVFTLRLQDGGASVDQVAPRCDLASGTVDLGWLSVRLGNLSVRRLEYQPGTGFDFFLEVDVEPLVTAAPDLPLPVLPDVGVGPNGFTIPIVSAAVPARRVTVAGFGFEVTRATVPGFILSWADWDAGSARDFRFTLDATLSLPDLPAEVAPCLTGTRLSLSGVALSDGALTATLSGTAFTPGCVLALGLDGGIVIEQLSGVAAISLRDVPALQQGPRVSGTLVLPRSFACDPTRDRRLPLPTPLELSPRGLLRGTVSGLSPPCPIALALEVSLEGATLALDYGPGGQSAALTGSASAVFAGGAERVEGSGTVEIDLIAGRLTGGAIDFAGPFSFDLPRQAPVLRFVLDAARLDTAGFRIDGRHRLTLAADRTVGVTFDRVSINPLDLSFISGRVLFDGSFGLAATISSASQLTWRAVPAGEPLETGSALRVTLPDAVVLDSSGLAVSGDAGGRLNYDGRDFASLTAAFSSDFALRLAPTGVRAGRLDLELEGERVAHVDRFGFQPNLTYFGIALLPARLGLPTEQIAYLALRDAQDSLLVTVSSTASGMRIVTDPGTTLPLVFPSLQGTRSTAPSLEVAVDLTLDPLTGGVSAGALRLAVPGDRAADFDLTPTGLPLAIDSLAFESSGSGYLWNLAVRFVLFGQTASAPQPVQVRLDDAGVLTGDIVAPVTLTTPLVPGSDRLTITVDTLRANFQAALLGGSPAYAIDAVGRLQLGRGGPGRFETALTVRVSDLGTAVTAIAPRGDSIAVFDLGAMDLGLANLSVPLLEYDESGGAWNFELVFDAHLDLSGFDGLEVPPVRGASLQPTGFALPEIAVPSLGADTFDLAGFSVRPLALRASPFTFDWFADGLLPDRDIRLDLALGFGPLGPGMPAVLRDLEVSVLDAAYRDGLLTGTIEPRSLLPAVTIPFGDAGLGLNLARLSGALNALSGVQSVTLQAEGSLRLPEFMRCAAAPGDTLALAGAALTLSPAAALTGTVTDLVPACPLALGPLALTISRTDLTFAVSAAAQQVGLALDGEVRLPGTAPGDTVVAAGTLGFDLLAAKVTTGSLAITQPFTWGFPAEAPLLTLVVSQGRLDIEGLHFTGAGGLDLGDGLRADVAFDDLTLGLPSLTIVAGSATFTTPFALEASIEGARLAWRTRAAGTPRSTGNALLVTVPNQAVLDATGFRLAGSTSAELSFADSVYATLQAQFQNEFGIGFDPVGVTRGRASLLLAATEIAYVDSLGFWPGDVFGALPIPAELGLPTADVGYLALRDAAGQLLVETSSVATGLRINTPIGQTVELVLAALGSATVPAPSIPVGFDVVVNPSTLAFLSGAIDVAAPEGGPPLFSLEGIGLPLEVRRVTYAPGSPYGLALDARVRLPASLDGLALDFTSLGLTAAGLTGTAELGDYRTDYVADAAVLASATLQGGLGVAITGARAAFGAASGIDLAGVVTTPFFSGSDGAPQPIFYTAQVGAAGVQFTIDPSQLPTTFPIDVATFAPVALGTDPPLALSATDARLAIQTSGVFRLPSIAPGFEVTLAGLSIGTDGVTLPDISLATSTEWQQLELFAASIVLKDAPTGVPAIQLDYANDILGLVLGGELTLLERTMGFRGLRLASDGSVALDGASLLDNPITIIDGVLVLDTLDVRAGRLHAGLALDLPAPLAQSGTQRGSFSIGPDGAMDAGGRIVLLNETEGLTGGSQFEAPLVTVHPRYLGLDVGVGTPGGGGIEVVTDLYLAHRVENRIKLGDVVGNAVRPGLRIGFDGTMAWANVELAREFDFDYQVVRLTVTNLSFSSPGTFRIGFGGRLAIAIPEVSGRVDFTDFGITSGLGVEVSAAGITGGSFSVAGIVNLQLDAFEYDTVPRQVSVQGGQPPTSTSAGTSATVDEMMATYLRASGSLDVIDVFAGGVEELLFYRTVDGTTRMLIRRASLDVYGAASLLADFRYESSAEGFEFSVGATATLGGSEYVVVGTIGEYQGEPRVGLFATVPVNTFIPPFFVLRNVGGGFFYNPSSAHLALVKSNAGLSASAEGKVRSEPGRFAVLLYADITLIEEAVGIGRVLLTLTESHFTLDGAVELLSQGDRMRGEVHLAVGLQEAFAEGNIEFTLDYGPIASSAGSLGFFAYDANAWGVMGSLSIEFVGLLQGEGSLFVGPPGFFADASIGGGFDIWLIGVNADFDASLWFREDVEQWGAYLGIGVEVSVLAGAASATGTMHTGLILTRGAPFLYGEAELAVSVAWVGSWEGSVWAKFADGDVDGGFGSDPAMAQILADARSAARDMAAARDDVATNVATARPPPALVTLSEEELAQAYARIQGWAPAKFAQVARNARSTEEGFAPFYDRTSSEIAHLQRYEALLAQEGIPSPDTAGLASLADSVEAFLGEIASRRGAVGSALQQLQLDLADLTALAVAPFPASSPVSRASITVLPAAQLGVDAEGRTTKTLANPPGFEIDGPTEQALRQSLDERIVRAETSRQEVWDRIVRIRDGLGRVRAVTTADTPESLLGFARLHSRAVAMAERQYATHADAVLRRQDWFRTNLADLGSRRATVETFVRNKTLALADTAPSTLVPGLARNRIRDLADWTDSPELVTEFDATAGSLADTDPWFRDQADSTGMMNWYHLARAGMEAADSAADREFGDIRAEAESRLRDIRALHRGVSQSLDRLYASQAALTGSLYDLYGRWLLWTDSSATPTPTSVSVGPDPLAQDPSAALEDALAPLLDLTSLEAQLRVPTVDDVVAVSTNQGYRAKHVLFAAGSHPSGIYEYRLTSASGSAQPIPRAAVLYSNGAQQTRVGYSFPDSREATAEDRTLQVGVRGGAGFVGIGRTSYTVTYQDGGAGVGTSTIATQDADATPPTNPTVVFPDVELRDGAYWTADPERVTGKWVAIDPESGIAEYQYWMGTAPGANDLIDTTSAGGRGEVPLERLGLVIGTPAHLTVRARNGAGLWSAAVVSKPLRYDPTPPTWPSGAEILAGHVDTTGALTAAGATIGFTFTAPPFPACTLAAAGDGSSGTVDNTWSGSLEGTAFDPASSTQTAVEAAAQYLLSTAAAEALARASGGETPQAQFTRPAAEDPESGVLDYFWRVDTLPAQAFSPEGWTRRVTTTPYITVTDAPLDYRRQFYLSVVAGNYARVKSAPVVFGPFRVPDPTPPTGAEFCAMPNGQSAFGVRLDSISQDDETEIAGYQYRIRSEAGAVARDWPQLTVDWLGTEPAGAAVVTAPLTLTDGTRYLVDVRSFNGHQQPSAVFSSGPMLHDGSPPMKPAALATATRSAFTTTLNLTVNAPDDPHSGLSRQLYGVGTDSTATDVVSWRQVSGASAGFYTTSETVVGTTGLQSGRTYWLHFRTVNGVGLSSGTHKSRFTVP